MSKLYCDRMSAESIVNTNLDSSIVNLKNVSSIFSNIVIPSGFKYKQYLIETNEKIALYINNLDSLNLKMRESYKLVSSIETELKNSLIDIENYSIKTRQSAIR